MAVLAVLVCATAFVLLPIAVIHGRDALMLDVGKLIIDSDAGGDDAVAIMMTLGHQAVHGQLEVIAVTCVVGNTGVDNVVNNVFKTLDTVNRLDIPVYRGAADAIHTTPTSDNFFGMDGFGDFEYPNPPDSGQLLQKQHAVNALIELTANNPGEVSVLCLGPLTNIALAIRLDPKFLANIRQLFVVGASVEGYGNVKPGIEFNFFADPEAAYIVFNSTDTTQENVNPVILLPWESVINRNIIPTDWRLNMLGALGSAQMLILNQAEAAILHDETWPCADAMMAAIAVNSSLVETSATHYLQVEAQGTSAGMAFVDYFNVLERLPNAIIIQTYNVEAFKVMLLKDLA